MRLFLRAFAVLATTFAVAGNVRADEALSDLVSRHADVEALAELERLPVTPERRYLRGRLLERRGELVGAAEAYASTEGLPTFAATDARERRARLLARLGRCPEAVPLLEAERGGLFRALAIECRARTALEASNAEALAELLGPLATVTRDTAPVRGVDTFALRALRVEILAQLGRTDEAQAERRAMVVELPDHPEADAIAAALGEVTWSPEERLRRADALYEARRYADAAAQLRGVTPPRDLRPAWLHRFGMSLYRARHFYAEAASVLAESARLRHVHRETDAFHAARALARADRDADSIRALRAFVRAYPRGPHSAEAEHLAAWLEARLGRAAAARRSFQRFLAGPRAALDAGTRRDANWHLGFEAYRARRWVEAARHLEAYASGSDTPLIAGRGHYWAARAHEARGARSAAVEGYRRATSYDALGWYAIWSRRRLVALGVVAETDPPALDAPSGRAPTAAPLTDEARFYASLGLRADAVAAQRRGESGNSAEKALARYEIGDFEGAYRLAAAQRSRLGERPSDGAAWAWQLAYPKPFEAAVRAEAERHGLPWEHVYATMRQESAYDPDAVSFADAIGLLQVMPESGARAARSLGLPFDRDRLFDPTWNVRLGVAEMSALFRRFDDALPLVIAAYNAGTARVERWLAEEGDVEMDLFVERIPFDETRGYVRRVISHFARYRFAEDPTRFPDVPLPGRTPARH
ncbi:MAG: lytic transglycosylase domain-containing protein [Sandaracinus sp.]|nr:lytic transglycosylase domain-containing protein [Sandaracinus sp.]MCB9621256.1 lytic transglycosylase domain-containing protein [Sandaracinus sp.]MCB9622196.1 lytic transglycosylase domain-containing protein [Sandaracinus sp.]MCB9636428.1 lytic transglycosylase domain-containing protein [Sandaracinus sp.]